MDAGIPLVDNVGDEVFTSLHEGTAHLEGGRLLDQQGAVVAEGTLYTTEILDEQLQYAREGLSDHRGVRREHHDLPRWEKTVLEGVGVPDVRTEIEGRHVLIVVRGYDYRSDLDLLRPYISEYRPLLIGVDGGADALIEAGFRPDMIIGDMDSCSDDTLRSGAELVVHAYHDGRAPGLERISALGLEAVIFPMLGTSEDAAMMLADFKGPGCWLPSHPPRGGVPDKSGRHGRHLRSGCGYSTSSSTPRPLADLPHPSDLHLCCGAVGGAGCTALLFTLGRPWAACSWPGSGPAFLGARALT